MKLRKNSYGFQISTPCQSLFLSFVVIVKYLLISSHMMICYGCFELFDNLTLQFWKYYRIWTSGENFLFTLRKKFHFLSASKYTNNIHFYFIIMPILRSMIRAYKSHMKCHECTLTILYSKLYMHLFLMMSFETLQYFEVQNAYSIFLACGHDT